MAYKIFVLKNTIAEITEAEFLDFGKKLRGKQVKEVKTGSDIVEKIVEEMEEDEGYKEYSEDAIHELEEAYLMKNAPGAKNGAQGNSYDSASDSVKVKRKKERSVVILTTRDTAREALSLADISYEGDIKYEGIEFCKVEALQECMYGNLHIPKLNDVCNSKFAMFFFVNRKNIVIVDDDGFAEKIIHRIRSSRTKQGQNREHFLYNFFVKMMSRDLENLGRYEKRIMQIEEEIQQDNLDDIPEQIALFRKELLILREYYDELMDVGKELEENENHFFSRKNEKYFGIISDRADRLMGRTMYLLDLISQVRESYQSRIAEQQNDNMQFLTVISTIFMPLTLITGWYGMNFQNMPELTQGYPGVICLSLIVIAIIIFIFKKKKML